MVRWTVLALYCYLIFKLFSEQPEQVNLNHISEELATYEI